MAQTKSITFHRRAAMALDALSRLERAKVRAAVRRMQDRSGGALTRSKAARLPTPEPLYVLRASPELRVIFRRTADAIDVLDVVRPDQLESFARSPGPRPRQSESRRSSTGSRVAEEAQGNGTAEGTGDAPSP